MIKGDAKYIPVTSGGECPKSRMLLFWVDEA